MIFERNFGDFVNFAWVPHISFGASVLGSCAHGTHQVPAPNPSSILQLSLLHNVGCTVPNPRSHESQSPNPTPAP